MSKKTDRISKAKEEIIAQLKRRKITTATIHYDGEADEGQIHMMHAENAAGDRVKIKPALETALDDFAWEVLAHHHESFYDNHGGYGEIVIDVTKGTAVIEHNQRHVETSETRTEV